MSCSSRYALDDRILAGGIRMAAMAGGVLAVAGSVAFVVMGHAEDAWNLGFSLFTLFAVFFAVFVLFASRHQFRNRVVWVMTVSTFCAGWYVAGSAVLVALAPDLLADLSTPPANLPHTPGLVLMLVDWAAIPTFLPMLTLGVLLFPNGRLPSRRWRSVAWLAVAAISFATFAVVLDSRPASSLPIDQDGALVEVGFLAGSLIAALSLISLVPRYQGASGAERQQIKWIAWGASVMVGSILVSIGFEASYPEVARLLILLATVVLLGSYGIAVGKYRLYDIDIVINRTVVLLLLASFITLIYALVVVGIGSLIGGAGDGLALPIAATALVAVVFEPVRQRAQRWANRVVYGNRATPYEVLSDLTRRLAASEDASKSLDTMTTLLVAGTGADRATVWLGAPGDMRPGATRPLRAKVDGEPNLDADTVFPVYHDGEVVGAIELVKPRGSTVTPAEKRLMSDLAGSAGLVLGYRRLNDALEERADELRESRRRLLGAQDRERRRLERDLRDGAQQRIASLELRLDAASNRADAHGVPKLNDLLRTLSSEAREALEEVRALAKGIYPPILESEGLSAAISSLAVGSPVDIEVDVNGIRRYPSDVEAAVYFDISEAVTNAVKHAAPPIRIEVGELDEVLRFAVKDAGPGFDLSGSSAGSGLTNMADRLEAVGGRTMIASTGDGTTVIGEVPLNPVQVES